MIQAFAMWVVVCGALIVMKVMHIIVTSWWLVLAPLYMPLVFISIICTLIGAYVFIVAFKK